MTPSAPADTNPVREAFLAALRAAELFAPLQLGRVEAAVPADVATPAAAAGALVAAGHLTKFQAERLLAGKTDGYHLGPYVILEQVGRGSMGRVYKARHRTMNRPVAVKVLAAELTRTEAERQAFQKGVRAAAQLNHANIVTTYDANELAARFYIVLEFVDGPNLEALVKERGPLPVAEVCELARQAAVGLEHARGHGMIHRDLKPTNLLVARPSKATPDPILKIADFGIEKLSSSASLAQTPLPGTEAASADYIAPEQAHNPTLADHRTDLYSLGAVLYFLLTGRPPFAGGTIEEKVRRHLWEEPARLELLRPDVPPVLALLVHQMLAKNPAYRPASAAEVADRLTAIVQGFADGICFDLPAPHSGAYTAGTAPLSAAHAVTPLHTAPPTGRYPPAPSPVYPVPAPQSPWEQVANANAAEEAEAEETRPRSRRARRGRQPVLPTWMIAALTIGLVALCAGAVAVIVKTLGK